MAIKKDTRDFDASILSGKLWTDIFSGNYPPTLVILIITEISLKYIIRRRKLRSNYQDFRTTLMI